MKKIFKILIQTMAIMMISCLVTFADDSTSGLDKYNEYTNIFNNMSDEDYVWLERVVYREAARCIGDETSYEQLFPCCVAVVETVMNRVLDDMWPNTVTGVVTDRRWGQQFCNKAYKSENALQDEAVSDAITYVIENGRTQLPSTNYQYFATKKQSLGKNHLWIGGRREDGSVWKSRGMYFCEGRD